MTTKANAGVEHRKAFYETLAECGFGFGVFEAGDYSLLFFGLFNEENKSRL